MVLTSKAWNSLSGFRFKQLAPSVLSAFFATSCGFLGRFALDVIEDRGT